MGSSSCRQRRTVTFADFPYVNGEFASRSRAAPSLLVRLEPIEPPVVAAHPSCLARPWEVRERGQCRGAQRRSIGLVRGRRGRGGDAGESGDPAHRKVTVSFEWWRSTECSTSGNPVTMGRGLGSSPVRGVVESRSAPRRRGAAEGVLVGRGFPTTSWSGSGGRSPETARRVSGAKEEKYAVPTGLTYGYRLRPSLTRCIASLTLGGEGRRPDGRERQSERSIRYPGTSSDYSPQRCSSHTGHCSRRQAASQNIHSYRDVVTK